MPWPRSAGSQPTYEELNQDLRAQLAAAMDSSQPTYEELKPAQGGLKVQPVIVPSLPMRN